MTADQQQQQQQEQQQQQGEPQEAQPQAEPAQGADGEQVSRRLCDAREHYHDASRAAMGARGPSGSPLPTRVQHVDPWSVQGGADGKIDYNKLVEQVP